ncbi:MAG TPA: acyl-CoA reductase, partial [Verrucomicrobiae bacterium]|nr:acyl-CoA reductase [Verrucomicrobiae bacterium]
NIHSLLVQDLGTAQRLDRFSTPEAIRSPHAAIATAPEILVQIVAGNLPVSAMSSLLFGLLIRSAQFIKCGTGAACFPRLLAHSLVDTEPGLAACLEIAEWPGGTRELEEALFAEADLVTATGSDETLAAIHAQLPLGRRFVGYGHRVSFGFITRDALGGFTRTQTVDRAADDVVAWDQGGCLSPHVFYVESGGPLSAESFAEQLAEALARREETHPRRKLDVRDAAIITLKRDFYDIRAAASPDTRLWRSTDNTAWTVVFEGDPQFQSSCLNRFIYVKPVSDLAEVLRGADSVRGKVSTVGIAGPDHRIPELAMALARWGVPRVCPLGRMQAPPLTWRHDGRPALGDLITWTDLER